jgi:hypothetical protein
MFFNALGLSFEAEFEMSDLDGLIGVEFRARTINEEYNRVISTKIEEYLVAPEFNPSDPEPSQKAKEVIDTVNFAKALDAAQN